MNGCSAASTRSSKKVPASARGIATGWSGAGVCVGTSLRKSGVWIGNLSFRAGCTSISPALARSQRGYEREDNPLSCHAKLLSHGQPFASGREM